MIRKAVIPAAGFGTRFLPATKAIPKEMIPVVDTPTIEYVVREAVESGIEDILVIVSRGKRAIEEHFSRNFELETALLSRNKTHEAESILPISGAKIHYVWQHEQNGLGDAILHSRMHVGNEPFAVLLGDTIMDSNTLRPATAQLMEVYSRYNAPVVGSLQVPAEYVSRYGIIAGRKIDKATIQVEKLVEKPDLESAPSRIAIASRYILTPEIFKVLDRMEPSASRELGLTEALQLLLGSGNVYARVIDGKRLDIGNKLEFIKANILLGLKRSDIGSDLREWISKIQID